MLMARYYFWTKGKNSQLASSSQSETLAVVKQNLNLEKEVSTQLIIPNINSAPSTPRTASFTAAKQKCLTCKGQATKLIHVGGTDLKDVIRRCMPQLVDDDILRQLGWRKRKEEIFHSRLGYFVQR
ncbi:hypothetical protein JTB14_023387 [Gonioctena quinquepunctata]|nr:hypothetical protein JTB14_023387 [Gonioctena quinquepunctata]